MRYHRKEGSGRGFWGAFFGTIVGMIALILIVSAAIYLKANETSKIEKHSYLWSTSTGRSSSTTRPATS